MIMMMVMQQQSPMVGLMIEKDGTLCNYCHYQSGA